MLHLKTPRALLPIALFALVACSTPTTRVEVPEIRPGVAAGYLDKSELPDSIALLPPPPAPGSAAFRVDEERSRAHMLRDTPRWAEAIRDANLQFPQAANTFACAIGMAISEEVTPNLYGLLRRTRTDGAVVSDAAKHHHQRARPFMANGEPICTPEKQADLAENGSYPSGHTSIGWTWALILAELFPERVDAILARGIRYGENRMVCNVHWQSDVDAGMRMGTAVVARLHGDPAFRRDMALVRAELAAAKRHQAPPGSCENP